MTAVATSLFDGLLALSVLGLAWQTLHSSNLFRAVVSFMVFGLLMAVAWVRLQAPDVALAEAAIGAGVTGALLLSTLGRLHGAAAVEEQSPPHAKRRPNRGQLLLWTPLALILLALLGTAAWQLPAPGLGGAVAAELAVSGAQHPVTAVLLNFRAYDTLLEVAVLLLAVAATWSLGGWLAPPAAPMLSPLLPALVRLLAPGFLLVGVYLLWRGGHAPGGAFPAGAVLGAGGVLLMLAGTPLWDGVRRQRLLVTAQAAGLLLFVAMAVVTALGRGFLDYPGGLAYPILLAIELATAAAIAVMLSALYLGGEPPPAEEPPP